VYAIEYAMRFDMRWAGTVRWLEACFRLYNDAAVHDYVFDFAIYSDDSRTVWHEEAQAYEKGSRPGLALYGPRAIRVLLPFANRETYQDYTCVSQSVDVPVRKWPVWAAVRMPGYGLRKQMRIPGAELGLDQKHARSEDPYWRHRDYYGSGDTSRWSPTFQSRVLLGGGEDKAYFIRMGVEHADGTDGFDRLSPGEQTDCHPSTTPLVFDGGYEVSLCYETAKGEVGEAKGGIWASGQSGLLWFFDRGNAEVLIKVLDGCSHNDRRWVFVAPVTDVAFNLHVTDSRGLLWTHRNRLGVTASPKSDTSAFPCE
jgi:hypothetical protein